MSSSWNPTHVVVAVQRAKDLISKGKNGTNDAFVTIGLSDNKFQTTVKDKVIDPEWYEECDVPLPENYDEHKLIIQVFHRNNLGIDEFLGHLDIPLRSFDVYDAPRSIWYPLACKPGQNKTKPRGEIEVRLAFEVKKVKDLDSMSTTSSASKRFKMSKKTIKHAASALGRKIKGPKNKETSEYVPDLTGLPDGALDMDDIAENYSTPVVVPKKKLSTSDSLSLPPESPAFHRSSPRSSKGYSPFTKRKSRGDADTPPSSNASVEDVKQKADDADSTDGSFLRTHRRGGSGSDLKTAKPNRRLLTARPKSSSTADVSATPDFETVGDRTSALLEDPKNKSRARTTTSGSLSNEALPELMERKNEESIGKRSSAALVIPDQPELIDDDSDDSMAEYTPSPIVPLVKKEEPTDLFARMAAQMQKEGEDEFNLVKHEAQPGEEVFTPIGKLSQTATAHSTPIVEVQQKPEAPSAVTDDRAAHDKLAAKIKSKDKKKKKGPPPPNVFDLLMASDEPEFNVDDTLPDGRKAKNRSAVTDANNPFSEKKTEVFSSADQSSNPFDEDSSTKKDKHQSAPTAKHSAPVDSNPFDEPSKPSADSNPFDEPSKPSADSNPFEEAESGNPFEEPEPVIADKNPFGELESDKTKVITTDEQTANNPFEELTLSTKAEGNPFEEPKSTVEPVNNPFEEDDDDSLNPFGDDDDDDLPAPSSFNRAGSFARKGSSRFAGSGRQKKREKKAAAPPPPKPQRTGLDKEISTSTVVSSPSVEPPAPSINTERDNISIKSDTSPAESPRGRYKKDKKAPQAPAPATIQSKPPRARSSSHNLPTGESEVTSTRRGTDTSKMEALVNSRTPISSKSGRSPSINSLSKNERQPAVGAEAPDLPSEPRVMRDAGVQVNTMSDDSVPAEFRNTSKQELIEMVQMLRQQCRRKDDHAADLEEYIDSLLLRVMSADPNLLVAQASCAQQAQQVQNRR